MTVITGEWSPTHGHDGERISFANGLSAGQFFTGAGC